MKRKKTRILSLIFAIVFALPHMAINAADISDSIAAVEFVEALEAKSVILIEAATGTVLCEKNADEALPPASVTKVMTMLLVMEAIDDGKILLGDMVSVSERAASMGGSQVYLKVGEQMTVEDMLKSVVVSSANDAAVALAEFVSGSEEAFVVRMNERAAELGMKNSHFVNTNGLDDGINDHLISARDIAIMSRELIVKHPKILEYTSIWMDTIRDGAFGLTNTNRLIRFYSGANGLKTGSTSKAKFCISATALRDGMQLIAVVMGAPNRDVRNETAKRMLDYGFSNYSLYSRKPEPLTPVRVTGGVDELCGAITGEFTMLLKKGSGDRLERLDIMNDTLSAPISAGEVIGYSEYRLDGEVVGKADIYASDNVERIGYFGLLIKLLKNVLLI